MLISGQSVAPGRDRDPGKWHPVGCDWRVVPSLGSWPNACWQVCYAWYQLTRCQALLFYFPLSFLHQLPVFSGTSGTMLQTNVRPEHHACWLSFLKPLWTPWLLSSHQQRSDIELCSALSDWNKVDTDAILCINKDRGALYLWFTARCLFVCFPNGLAAILPKVVNTELFCLFYCSKPLNWVFKEWKAKHEV